MGETNCPTCGLELADGRGIAGRKRPGHNNVSICRGCGEVLVLTESAGRLALRPTTASEYLGLPEESQALLRVAFKLVQRQQRTLRPRPMS